MSKRHLALGMICLLVFLPVLASAEVPVTERFAMDGELFYRVDVNGNDFNDNTGFFSRSWLRTQLGAKFNASDEVFVRIRIRESRRIGVQGSNALPTAQLEFQEAYLCNKNIFGSPFSLQLGRFPITHGRLRILGSGGWNAYGPRTYDGAQFRYDIQDTKLDLFYSKVIARAHLPSTLPFNASQETTFSAQDRHLMGITGSLYDGLIQPIILIDWDLNPVSSTPVDANLIVTPALYSEFKRDNLKIQFDGGLQFGNYYDKDLFAFLVSAEVGYKFDHKVKPMLALGADITSGNSLNDPVDEDHVFRAPFMSRHAYRGYMDYFQDVDAGLVNGIVRLGFQPMDKLRIRADIHHFMYMKERYLAAPDGTWDTSTSYTTAGDELDLNVFMDVAKGFTVKAHYCLFLASDEFATAFNPASNDLSHLLLFGFYGRF